LKKLTDCTIIKKEVNDFRIFGILFRKRKVIIMSKVLVETSARHLHVTKEHFEILFGAGAELTPKKDLSQPGQYACAERVTVVGPKKELAGVSILGPFRKETQIELSASDARSIGIKAPVRQSGEVAGSGACKLVGPCGEVELNEGVIVAKRHIHMTTADAAEMGIVDNQIVNVKIESADRSLVFGDVVVRVSDSYALAMHIDTDESNAAGCAGEVYGEVIK
jgi:putative phosphotransacetylase